MKKLISLTLCLAIVFCSFSLCFASATEWDTADQANLRAIKNLLDSGGTFYNLVSTISSNVSTINNRMNTLLGYLTYNNHSVADLIDSILTWMSPIYNAIATTPTNFSTIIAGLGYYDNNTFYPYLNNINTNLFTNTYTVWGTNIGSNGTISTWTSQTGNWITAMFWHLQDMKGNFIQNYQNVYSYLASGYNNQQTSTNWLDLSNVNWTPTSVTNGIYTWFSNIQRPVARLSYVLASDERIAAQEAAADVEQAVVDDFIDSSGDASASTSDIGSIADLSAGYKQNFGSTASVTGIFDIFNSNNFGWFSSETAQQLDTTTQMRSSSFATPLLDQQIEEINNALGVTHAD